MTNHPKVLVGIITAEIKQYCQPEFFEQLHLLTYPHKEIYFVDNSATNDNYKKIIKAGFNAYWLPRKNKGVRQIMAESNEIIRQHVIRHKYDYLMNLESDIMLQKQQKHQKFYDLLEDATDVKIVNGHYDIIEQLMFHRKQVIGAVYDTNAGSYRRLCVHLIDNQAGFLNPYPVGKSDIMLLDGKTHKVFSTGIGACLITRQVLEKIRFHAENDGLHPDANFSHDIYNLGIDFFADTSIYLTHKNQDWGAQGMDYE